MLNSIRDQHPSKKIGLTFEIEAAGPIVPSSSNKRRAPETDTEASSLPPSSPPAVQKKKGKRTEVLEEQSRVRLDKILYASEWERQLTDRLTCKDKDCPNSDNFCFPDPLDPKQHYNVTAAQQKSWADAITSGHATLANPPARVLLYWQHEQGAISRESRAPARKTFQQETKASIQELREQVEIATV